MSSNRATAKRIFLPGNTVARNPYKASRTRERHVVAYRVVCVVKIRSYRRPILPPDYLHLSRPLSDAYAQPAANDVYG